MKERDGKEWRRAKKRGEWAVCGRKGWERVERGVRKELEVL